ncbi:hypothetical protein KFE25_002324 [Diacronema lutheri]|uniref:RING-CH-type domain-containing protein n=1 Tax=Diacronema lutheri TaxID=2081491 RepID=A0A8J5XAT2_DIALT|nr:hypothetical protein KFE25_002324 [Diacronema lutheri]
MEASGASTERAVELSALAFAAGGASEEARAIEPGAPAPASVGASEEAREMEPGAPAPAAGGAGSAASAAPPEAAAAVAATEFADIGDTVHCIFCLEEADAEHELLKCSPCACSGTLTSIHTRCLTKDIEHNLRLECPICRYPYHYKAKVASQGLLLRTRKWLSRVRNARMCALALPTAAALIMLGIILTAVGTRSPSGGWAPFVYAGMSICMLLFFYTGVSVNELPVRVIRVVLYAPSHAQLELFEENKEAWVRLMKERGGMGTVGAALLRGKRADADEVEVLSLDYPVTLQMMADREVPPALAALIVRTNEAAKLAEQQATAEAQQVARAADTTASHRA